MQNTPLSELQKCIDHQFIVGLAIRYVPAMIFLCIERVDDQTLVVKDRDINGFEIPFKRQIKFSDIQVIKITTIRFEDPELVSIRHSYHRRQSFLNKPTTSYYLE